MSKDKIKKGQDRREFIKNVALTSTMVYFGFGGIFKMARGANFSVNTDSFEYKYKTFSVDHVAEVGQWFDKLKKENKLSSNEVFNSYIKGFNFTHPEALPNPKSVIVLSYPQKVCSINFTKKEGTYKVLIPTGYVASSYGLSIESVKEKLYNDIIKDRSKKLEWSGLPLKTIAVRSGLAEYGKNNIAYVDGYGSNHALLAFTTDADLEDHWGPLKEMRDCRGCNICKDACPTQIIGHSKYVINAGECVTLYNEISDPPMPNWIDPKAHNALVGCLKCQQTCPANEKVMKDFDHIADITFDETNLILNGGNDEELKQSIIKKLRRFASAQDFEYFSRNLKLVIQNLDTI